MGAFIITLIHLIWHHLFKTKYKLDSASKETQATLGYTLYAHVAKLVDAVDLKSTS